MSQTPEANVSASRNVVRKGPSVGRYMNCDIPAWIESGDGFRHEYSHILAKDGFKRLSSLESVVFPGLVYKTVQ